MLKSQMGLSSGLLFPHPQHFCNKNNGLKQLIVAVENIWPGWSQYSVCLPEKHKKLNIFSTNWVKTFYKHSSWQKFDTDWLVRLSMSTLICHCLRFVGVFLFCFVFFTLGNMLTYQNIWLTWSPYSDFFYFIALGSTTSLVASSAKNPN